MSNYIIYQIITIQHNSLTNNLFSFHSTFKFKKLPKLQPLINKLIQLFLQILKQVEALNPIYLIQLQDIANLEDKLQMFRKWRNKCIHIKTECFVTHYIYQSSSNQKRKERCNKIKEEVDIYDCKSSFQNSRYYQSYSITQRKKNKNITLKLIY
ncbi:unnamed protein product [Paramecium sonneborni]|uniref:Uncharacterized protein n=1 Tax=Paramecium sonneborni TaxID=65129 RepID=A0A8S1QJV4_9CILI|nr:unnamed protein product [Paramecium sonneborni]CAD8114675.1 unnamed protein product [Paramecium sonneborni]